MFCALKKKFRRCRILRPIEKSFSPPLHRMAECDFSPLIARLFFSLFSLAQSFRPIDAKIPGLQNLILLLAHTSGTSRACVRECVRACVRVSNRGEILAKDL